MEFHQLQYVIAVARDKHFTRAAKRLRIAQPSLSQQIAKLEQEIGLQLFDRSKSQVTLTYAGQLFAEKAQQIIDMAEQLLTEMKDVSQLKKGRLLIGSLPMTGSHVMPVILPQFRAQHPEIEVVLVEDTTANLEQLAASGDVDLALLSLPIDQDRLDCVPLLEESIVVALPLGHPLYVQYGNQRNSDDSIHLSELKDEPFIVLKKGQGFRQITIELCKAAGFAPNIVFESNNIETIQSLVAAGMGVALVPQMVRREPRSRHAPAYLPLADQGASRTLVIGFRKDRYLSKAAQAFIDTVQNVMQTAPEF